MAELVVGAVLFSLIAAIGEGARSRKLIPTVIAAIMVFATVMLFGFMLGVR